MRVLVCFILLLFPFTGLAEQPSSVPAYLFYSEECVSCEGILQGYLPTLKSLYPFLDVKAYDVRNPSYYHALTQLEKKFNRRGSAFPALFIGAHMLSAR